MKYTFTFFLVLFFFPFVNGQSQKSATSVIQTEIFCDHCLVCETCDAHVFNAIKDNTKGVRKIEVDPINNTITVNYNPKKTSLEEIEIAISNAGYKANEKPASEEGYSALDACCKRK